MDTEIRNLFHELADLAPDQREEYYMRHAVPAAVRAEIESLLSFDTRGGGTAVGSMIGDAVTDWAASDNRAPQEYCGPYRLLRMIARGGMGAVYLGERTDGEVSLRVAVKFLNAAIAGSSGFEHRFLKERQILASLSHPGIARLLDAGRTAEHGNPYLVMEYVDGVPIDAYCEKLDLRAKLQLVLEVCDAVSYSHRNLIIHRDLKPSNILVNSDGKAKLLDFGIAKILDEEAANSGMTRERLLTPEFASPEQELGQANTTATDVYSLGAVLRRLAGTEIPRDLGFIIRCAMRPEPGDRYPSADALAEDIHALLDYRPVKARSGEFWYSTQKLLRRHWLPATAVAAAVISLASGLFVANRERQVAESRFSQLRQWANTMLRFDASLRPLPGSTKARDELVKASLQYLEGLAAEVNVRRDPELALEIANGYKLMGEVQGVPRPGNLGQTGNAGTSLAKASAIVERVLDHFPADVHALLMGAEIASDRALLGDAMDSSESVALYSVTCANMVDRLTKTGKASIEQQVAASRAMGFVGHANSNMQMLDAAAQYLKTSVSIARNAAPDSPALVQGLNTLGQVLRRTGELDAALALFNESEAVYARASYPDEQSRYRASYNLLLRKGNLLGEDESISLGRSEEAVELLKQARSVSEKLMAADPNDASPRDGGAKVSKLIGDILRHTDPAGALAAYELSLQWIRSVDNIAARRDEARYLARSAEPLRKLGRVDEARRRIDQAFAMLHKTGDYPPPKDELRDALDGAMRDLGQHELETGNPRQARAVYERLLGWIEERQVGSSTLLSDSDMSRLYRSMARVYAALGMQGEAQKLETRREQIWRNWNNKLPGNAYIERQLRAKATK